MPLTWSESRGQRAELIAHNARLADAGLPAPPTDGLTAAQLATWAYQRFGGSEPASLTVQQDGRGPPAAAVWAAGVAAPEAVDLEEGLLGAYGEEDRATRLARRWGRPPSGPTGLDDPKWWRDCPDHKDGLCEQGRLCAYYHDAEAGGRSCPETICRHQAPLRRFYCNAGQFCIYRHGGRDWLSTQPMRGAAGRNQRAAVRTPGTRHRADADQVNHAMRGGHISDSDSESESKPRRQRLAVG